MHTLQVLSNWQTQILDHTQGNLKVYVCYGKGVSRLLFLLAPCLFISANMDCREVFWNSGLLLSGVFSAHVHLLRLCNAGPNRNTSPTFLESHDVVISTYSTLAHDFVSGLAYWLSAASFRSFPLLVCSVLLHSPHMNHFCNPITLCLCLWHAESQPTGRLFRCEEVATHCAGEGMLCVHVCFGREGWRGA